VGLQLVKIGPSESPRSKERAVPVRCEEELTSSLAARFRPEPVEILSHSAGKARVRPMNTTSEPDTMSQTSVGTPSKALVCRISSVNAITETERLAMIK
jgi:hypothetical protein